MNTRKIIIILAIMALSIGALFADYIVTYEVFGGAGELIEWGDTGFLNGQPYTNSHTITVSDNSYSWSETVGEWDGQGVPPIYVIGEHFLTRTDTGYTVTKTVTGNNLKLTIIYNGGQKYIPNMY